MADKPIKSQILIDYEVHAGKIDTTALVREMSAGLKNLGLPTQKITPNIEVDSRRTVEKVRAGLQKSIASADKEIQTQLSKMGDSKTSGSAEALKRQLDASRKVLQSSLNVMLQQEIAAAQAAINKRALSQGITRIEKGQTVGPAQRQALEQQALVSGMVSRQLASIQTMAGRVGSEFFPPQFMPQLKAMADQYKAFQAQITAGIAASDKKRVEDTRKRTAAELAEEKRYHDRLREMRKQEEADDAAAHKKKMARNKELAEARKVRSKERERQLAAERKAEEELAKVSAQRSRMYELQSKFETGVRNITPAETRELNKLMRMEQDRLLKAGDYAGFGSLSQRAAEITNPNRVLKQLMNDAHVTLGEQVLSSVGGVGGVRNVSADNAPYARAALQARITETTGRWMQDRENPQKYMAEIQQLEKAMNGLDVATRRTTGTVAQFFRYALGYGALYQALAAVSALGRGVTDLQRTLVAIKAVSGATDAQMVSVAEAIREVATSSRYSLTDIGEAAKLLAQAGVSADEMGKSLKVVTNLASAIEAPIAVVADLMTSMKEVFTGQSDESLANQLASAVNVSKLSAEGLQTIIGLSAGIAKDLNLETEQYLAAVATLKNAGLKDSTVATGLRQLLLELSSPDDKLVKALSNRYKAIGENVTQSGIRDRFFDFFQKPGGLVNAVTELERLGLGGEGQQELGRAFDIRAMNALVALARDKSSLVRNETSVAFSQAATIGSQQQLETVNAQLQIMKNSFVLLGDSIGRDALPPLMAFLDGMSDLINATAEFNEKLRADSGSGLGSIFGMGAAGAGLGAMFRGGNLRTRLGAAAVGGAAGAAGGALEVAGEQTGASLLGDALGIAITGAQLFALYKQGKAGRGGTSVSGTGSKSFAQKADDVGMTAINGMLALSTFLSSATLKRFAAVALRLVGGPWGLLIGGIASIAYWLYEKGPKDADDIRKQLDSQQRNSIRSSEKYRQLKDSMAEFDLSKPGQEKGLGLALSNVERQRASALSQIGSIAGGAANEVTPLLAAIFGSGGVSGDRGKELVKDLRQKYTQFSAIDDRLLTQLTVAAAEAQEGPKALAEKLSQQYIQLKELADPTTQQQQFIDTFERMRLDVKGFQGSSEAVMTTVRAFFNSMSETSSATAEELKAAKNEAEADVLKMKDKLDEALESGQFSMFISSLDGFVAAWQGLGVSASAKLRDYAKELRAQAAEIRKGSIFDWFKSDATLAAEKRQAEIAEGAATAADRKASQVALEARTGNLTNLQDLKGKSNTILSSLEDMSPEDAARYGGSRDVQLAKAVVNTPELSNLSGASVKLPAALLQELGLYAQGPEAEGALGGFDALFGTLDERIKEYGNAAERYQEAQRNLREENAKIAARGREITLDDRIAGLQGTLSKAGTLPELRDVFNKDTFGQLETALREKYGAIGTNLEEKIAYAKGDIRTPALKTQYGRVGIDELEKLEELQKKLEQLRVQKKDMVGTLDLKDLEARRKAQEDLVKLKEQELKLAIEAGAPVEVVNRLIDEQQRAQHDLAGYIGIVADARGEDGDAARDAALAATVGVDKEIASLSRLSQKLKEIHDDRMRDLPYTSIGMTGLEYKRSQARGMSLSAEQSAAQKGAMIGETSAALNEQYGIRAAQAKRLYEYDTKGVDKNTEAYRHATEQYLAAAEAADALESELADLEARYRYVGDGAIKNTFTDALNVKDMVNANTSSWDVEAKGMKDGVVGVIDGIGEAFARATMEGGKFKDVFRSITQSIAVDIASMMAKRAVWQGLKMLFSMFGADEGFTGDIFGGDAASIAARGHVPVRAAGGFIRGPGTGTSDSIPGGIVVGNKVKPLLVSTGESVLTANATKTLGTDFIMAANRGHIRRAAGGMAGRPAVNNTLIGGSTTENNIGISIPVSIETKGGTEQTGGAEMAGNAEKLAKQVEQKVREVVVKESRPGGLLWKRN